MVIIHLGLTGARRGMKLRTTVPDAKAPWPQNHVNRHFKTELPDELWAANFTDVSTWQGFVNVAVVIYLYARCIVGRRVKCRAGLQGLHCSAENVASSMGGVVGDSRSAGRAGARPWLLFIGELRQRDSLTGWRAVTRCIAARPSSLLSLLATGSRSAIPMPRQPCLN